MKEDDVVDTVYCSEQALLDCGFIPGTNRAYALTSINTVEIIDLETAELVTKIERFPHPTNYVIGVQPEGNTILIHCGNYKGEVFTYTVDQTRKQQIDSETGAVTSDCLETTSMLQSQGEETVVRNCLKVNEQEVLVTTENNTVEIYRKSENGPQFDLELDMEDDENPEEASGGKMLNKGKNKRGHNPF